MKPLSPTAEAALDAYFESEITYEALLTALIADGHTAHAEAENIVALYTPDTNTEEEEPLD